MSTSERKYRIVFRAKKHPDGPWWPDGKGGQICTSTIAYYSMHGAVFGTTQEEIFAEIAKNYPQAYDIQVVGSDNQRLDYEMIFGMQPADAKFAESYYA